MKIENRWRKAVHPPKSYFTSMWKWTCFCPMYIVIKGHFFIPLGFEIMVNDKFNGYKYHCTIMNFDFWWGKFKVSWVYAQLEENMKLQEKSGIDKKIKDRAIKNALLVKHED